MFASSTKPNKLEISYSKESQGLSQATLDIAKVYYSLGNFEQALDWCQSYHDKYGAHHEVIRLVSNIHLSADSASVKAQAQQFLQQYY
jgi:outer membrane protein assembly factor BamD (BamD/ComL family)